MQINGKRHLTGVRYALSVAWLALVLAELLGAQQGLGYLLAEGREFVRVDIVLCSILIMPSKRYGWPVKSKLLKQFGVLQTEPDWSTVVDTSIANQALGIA